MKQCNVLLILFFVVSVLAVHACATMKVIIDTDAGGDDAVALFLALSAPELEILAITCTYGNTKESNVETNVLKVLTVANRTDIPVYGGAEKPLLQNYTAGTYFGKDGLGDFKFDREIIGSVNRLKHASNAMVELVRQNPGEISILTLGPLTNVALAASLYSKFTKDVKRFYVMGATINDPNVEKLEIEFNFSLDPESNAIFLNSSFREKILVAPWDVVLKRKIEKEWRTEILGKLNSEKMRFLNQAEGAVLERLTEWLPADAIATATMIRPNLITVSQKSKMSSVTCGFFKGAVLIDTEIENHNVDVVRNFDVDGFKDLLLKYLL